MFNIPGAYLQADLPDDKFALLKFKGQFVDIMVEVNPDFADSIRYKNGKKVLYCRILKALYGMLESNYYGTICTLIHYYNKGSN